MKHLIILLLLVCAGSAGAQQHAIQYTKLSVGTYGIGTTQWYSTSATNSVTDSMWTAIQTTHTIGSDDVWYASKVDGPSYAAILAMNYNVIGTFSRVVDVTWPYKVASAFATPTVSGGAVTLPQSVILTVAPTVTNAASAAIPIPTGAEASYIITYNAGAGAYTLAAPTAGTDDGKILRVITASAQAHVITGGVDGFNAKGSSGTATFTATIGNAVSFIAYNGHWYAFLKTGVTIA